jgi:5-methylcytosine-specific restriction endonuclease McrA
MKIKLKQKIIELRDLGYTYNQIAKELNCSKSIICYHLGENQKEKTKKRNLKRGQDKVLSQKIYRFCKRGIKEQNDISEKDRNFEVKLNMKIQKFRYINHDGDKMESQFGTEELKERIKNVTHCELSGRPIDISDASSWQLDHKIPVSRGGQNTLDNVAILRPETNYAKHNMTNEELIELCKDILTHNGYKVSI